MSIYDWSVTAANNDNADANINWTEGQAANSVNNSARAEMAAFAAFLAQINGATSSTGSANAYAFASAAGNTITAYAAGNIICFKANHTNTGSATLNVDTLGAKTLKKYGDTNLAANDIETGDLVFCQYDGTNFQVHSALGNTNLEALAGLTGATDVLAYFTSSSAMTTTALTAFARTLLDDANATAFLATLGTGTAAVLNTGTGASDLPDTADGDGRWFKQSNNLSEGTAATMLSNLGIATARNITFGTGAPGALADGDIYLRHD